MASVKQTLLDSKSRVVSNSNEKIGVKLQVGNVAFRWDNLLYTMVPDTFYYMYRELGHGLITDAELSASSSVFLDPCNDQDLLSPK